MTNDVPADFDLDAYLARPLVARVATSGPTGPRVRPVWFLHDVDGFWWLTGTWSSMAAALRRDPSVELVIDTCELERREVLQVRARGQAELRPFDTHRAQQWGERYLGTDRRDWGRFATGVFDDPDTRFVLLTPTWLRARDLSW